MNKNSNSYIILYASVMVVIVAAVLSFVSLSLGGIQAENVRITKMGDILRSVGQGGDADHVADKSAYITEQYRKYIVDSYAVNAAGDRVEGADAFNLLINLKAEYDKPVQDRVLPVFVSRDDQGIVSYVIRDRNDNPLVFQTFENAMKDNRSGSRDCYTGFSGTIQRQADFRPAGQCGCDYLTEGRCRSERSLCRGCALGRHADFARCGEYAEELSE